MTDEQRQQFLKRLREEQESGDTEAAHGNADFILCEALTLLGYDDLVNEWHKVEKWYA